jgi:transposase
MSKRRRKSKSQKLEVIWSVSDALWAIVEPILLADAPPKNTGRPRADLRRVLEGIICRMRTGCQWNHLPQEFGDDSTVHRWFQRWNQNSVMERLWAALVAECDELGGVDWTWQAADAAMGKARFGGERNRPQSDGSRHIGDETQRGDRRTGGTAGSRHRRRQCA